ncbi:ABC transporter substrate-binding protein [Aureibacillus halotolerans]|uniref:Carbohydrate ABC transporter substrate-binding protein (CUT1 family) n=1 Tax=Aureibacillus halotolerans TaxID=1508390 RepID=A0A4R6TXB5_9BACI|nr:sugar ABC transporter substrate-binding protein [Aureibacillus halotolerans]TDQ36953.1 carbohydrate ABC transporter substrate-binding protein (CUT1 family) [Aureibacillus halotolerans]
MKRNFFIAALLMISFSLVASGCSSAPTVGTGGGEIKELTFTAWGNPAELDVYQRAVDEFNELEDGIEVTLVPSPSGTYDQSLVTRLQGGQAPDVFYISDTQIGFLVNNDTLLPLSEFLQSDQSYVDLTEFPDTVWGPAKMEGTIYALPPDTNPNLLYYNETIFEELGIPSPQQFYENGEWTWDTFTEVAEQLKAGGKYAFVQDANATGIYNWVWANGGQMFDEEGNVVIDKDPKTEEAFHYMRSLIDNDYAMFAGSLPQGQGQEALFLSKQVAMVAAGRWLTPMFLEAENLEFDYVPFPTNGDVEQKSFISIAYMGVNKDTPYPEAAKKFASFYTSTRGQKVRLSDNGNAVPSVNTLDDIIEGAPPEHAYYLNQSRKHGQVLNHEARIPSLSVELQDIYELMFIQEKSVEETLKDAGEMARFMKKAQAEDLED